ncbi:dephospho-CoA kinase [Tahibacter harae]|uniref:Dephospho-CoA kinase n=1 Tax=Tahibacter harae TaxID=2963937 RepID=A0ABT1QQ63_9GAMM|nr:dephospho-CoA kinase [Tahibacter harae]MCQ4164402.1 dephospho-CoA kinase [Tahibacter harae]
MDAVRVADRFVVAVSGGVASGKTAVTDAFGRRGVACYDADVAARAVVAPGEDGLAEIVARFGRDMLQADGSLDRAAMRRHIFAEPAARAALEAIVHPRVRRWLRERVAADRGSYCLLAIPLLAETWPAYAWVDRVLIVDVDPAVQLARLQQRDAIERELALKMIAAQASREQRLAIASDVIDNSGTLQQLDAAVEVLHRRFLELAQQSARR